MCNRQDVEWYSAIGHLSKLSTMYYYHFITIGASGQKSLILNILFKYQITVIISKLGCKNNFVLQRSFNSDQTATLRLCCSSVSAKVSVPYRHVGGTHVLMTSPFSLLEIRRTDITPSTALNTPACTLRRNFLSVFPSQHTSPPRYTKLSPWVSFFPPARCPVPSGGICAAAPSSLR